MTTGGLDSPSPNRPGRSTRRNLILVGYRGSGKTTVGRLVADALGWPFVDTDEIVEHAAGRSIAEIFRADGEARFRQLESNAVEKALAGTRQVISLGGGAVVSATNRDKTAAAGLCIWLTAPAEALEQRLAVDPQTSSQRPPLTGASAADEIRNLLAIRQPLYQAVADGIVDTSARPVAEVVQEVLAIVRDSLLAADAS